MNSGPTSRLIKTYLSSTHFPHALQVSLLFILLLFLTTELFWMDWHHLADLLPASAQKVFGEKEYWRLFTTTLVHANLEHLLSNSYMLFFLGQLVYRYFGPWAFPVGSLLFAALVNALSLLTYPPKTVLIGASGLVYLLGGLWMTLYVLIERQHHLGHRLFRTLGVSIIIFWPTTFEPSVSYRTHALGMALGLLLGLIFYAFKRASIRRFDHFALEEEEADGPMEKSEVERPQPRDLLEDKLPNF